MSLITSAKWNALSQFFKIFIQLVNMVYLATIIPPSEYGIMAMAAVVINLGVLLRDLGTAAAIIQKKELSNDVINAVFWFNVIIGFSLCILVFSLSPLIANLYHHNELEKVLAILSLTFPLSSCASAHLALLERFSRFKVISLIEVTSSLVSVVAAVILANIGYGVYSLVYQAIIMNLVSAIMFWRVSSWRPSSFTLSVLASLKKIFSFSANLSLFNIINYFSRNADSFIVGKYMSAFVLGNYNLAYRIMLFPLASLTFVFGRSLYPIMSRHQDDIDYVRNVYLKCVFFVLLFSFPMMSGIALLSNLFVHTVFGHQWYITGKILQWLAPTAILQSVISTTGSVFSSRNRTDILLLLGIIGTTLQLTSFLLGVHFDIVTFAKFYFFANVINFFPPVIMALKLLGSNLVDLFLVVWPVIISTAFMLAVCYYLLNVVLFFQVGGYPQLIVYSAIGCGVYFFMIFITSVFIREKLINFFIKLSE